MSPTRIQTQTVKAFACLGGECPDTCCKGWGMQLTEQTVNKYKADAPHLLEAVTSGEAEFIMRRDPATDYCVKFDNGWCSIHRTHGEDFLGDACHFYPRITRAIGSTLMTSAAMSCPETARLMLFGENPFALSDRSEVRVPFSMRNVLPGGLSEEQALAIHQAFMDLAGDEAASAANNLMRVSAVARGIERQPIESWAEAVPFYASMAQSRIPVAEPQPADIFNLLHALQGLISASPKQREGLRLLVADMAAALGASFTETGAINLASDAQERALRLLAHQRVQAPHLASVLRRYLQAQLSQALFPFAGFGASLSDRVTVIGVRLATLRLALATLGAQPSDAEIVATCYNLSRFIDHLADPTLSLAIYNETGWVREARLRAILGE